MAALLRADGLRRLFLLLVAAVLLVVPWRPDRPDRAASQPEYGVACLAVGAWSEFTHPSHTSAARRLPRPPTSVIGPLTIRRSFDGSLPVDFDSSAAGRDAAAGLHSFVSWKPPGGDHRGVAAGRYDRRIATWARSVPATACSPPRSTSRRTT